MCICFRLNTIQFDSADCIPFSYYFFLFQFCCFFSFVSLYIVAVFVFTCIFCVCCEILWVREKVVTQTHIQQIKTAPIKLSAKIISWVNLFRFYFSLQRFFLFSSSVNNDGYCNICCNFHSFSFIMLGNVVCIYKCSIYLRQLAVRIVNASWNGFVWALFRVEKKSFGFAFVAAIFFVSNRNFFAGRRCCFRMNRTTFMLLMV